MKTAVSLLLASWLCQWGPKPPAPADLIRRTAARFEATGSVFDLPRSGRKRKLTDAMARKAAKIFKCGYEVFRSYGNGQPAAIEREYYTSINEALANEPALEAIRAEADISPKEFLNRMKAVDPGLVRRRRDLKRHLSLAQQQARQKAAKQWWRAYKYGGKDDYLKKLVFIDEATIFVCDAAKANMKVWCDAGDDNACGVLMLAKMKEKTPIKLRFYIAVSPVYGPLMITFTTGTTKMNRRYNQVAPPFEDEDGQEWFEVRLTLRQLG